TGLLTATGGRWTSFSTTSPTACAVLSRIYCFGIGNNVVVTTPPLTGRRAFVSTAVSSGGGVASFDDRCRLDAAAAGLAGTFHAFVATSTVHAIDRFDTAGARWERLDGIALAPMASDLAVGLRVPLSVHADGSYDTTFERTWTGADDPSTVDAANSCSDWTSTSPSGNGFLGEPHRGGPAGFHSSVRRCDDTTHYVYCLEP